MVSAHALSAPAARRHRRGGPQAFCAWLGAFLALALAAPALAASPAAGILQQLQSGAGVAATERNATDLALLAGFYEERQMQPLWTTGGAATARAQALATILATADRDGLNPDDYGAAALRQLLGATAPDALAELELRLSLGLIQFASDLASGRLEPSEVDPELFVYPQDVDHGAVIRAAAATGDLEALVAGFRPAQDEYRRLQAALADFRARAASGAGWGTVPDGPTLEPGMSEPRVAALRARLLASNDTQEAGLAAAAPAGPEGYDPQLEAAVMRFQDRHGLARDGKVGPRTLAALNAPIEERIRQMVLNLERRRWMADDPGDRYVFVNLADFELKVVHAPKTVFDTRVVVGAPYNRTPAFSAEMTYLEINPYWNVPPSIARDELLPAIKNDPGYLAANGFELLSDWNDGAPALDPRAIDWSRINAEEFAWRLRQRPGEGNALGRIKFMFPNTFNVYLHDTPARHLFERAERSFSHGCIRVEQPEAFGAVVLAGQDDWSLERIKGAIASGERMIVPLQQPLPVHIAYLTAFVNKDGSVHFRNDVYGRDALLAQALLGPRADGG
jgi:murein L,D-transpeptidase YcbB/YkuD